MLSPRWRLLQDACKSPLHLWHVCCCRMYAFDVHCNSYFPLFLLLYGKLSFSLIVSDVYAATSQKIQKLDVPCIAVGQYLITPVLLWKSFLSAILSCLLYGAAFSYYHYLSFLGYSALPFLEHTEVDTSLRQMKALCWMKARMARFPSLGTTLCP